ncbi:MAG: hypothetical protein ACPGWR_21015 [Ardenticatenaceae bacterium]
MLSNLEFSELISDMSSDDLLLRAATLEVLGDYAERSADERVLPYLERLLDDKTPCLIGIPFIYAEIRWLAAHALAAQRAALGINEPVQLSNVVKPIDSKGYSQAKRAANIRNRGGLEGVLENIALLRDMGYLPLIDLYLSPFDEYPHPPTSQIISVNGMQQKSRQLELVPA